MMCRKSAWWSSLLPQVVPILFFVLISGWASRKMSSAPGPLTFGKSRTKIHGESLEIAISFKNGAAVEEAKIELMEVVDFLKLPAKYQKLWGRIPQGVLLVSVLPERARLF